MGARTGNSTTSRRSAARKIAGVLGETWPDAHVELDHRSPFELLVATILSAQSTDKMINTITPALFAKYPDARALAQAEPAEVEPLIFKSGFFRNKAKSIVGMARALVERHGGEVPRTMEALIELPGVARKTANVVLGSALGVHAGVVVDTHVARVAARLGLTKQTDPVKIEADLMDALPQEQWTDFAHRVIWHGRRVCFAKAPDCDHCKLLPLCPTGATINLRTASGGAARPDKSGLAIKLSTKLSTKKPAKGKLKPMTAKRARR